MNRFIWQAAAIQKRTFLYFFLMCLAGPLAAQVSGVSASKLTAIDATLVPRHTLEAEPSYVYLFSRKSFDGNGNLQPLFSDPDTAVILKDMFFRFTYGTGKRLEIGTMMTSGLTAFSFGAKYRFVQHKKFLAVALLGLNFSNVSNFGIRRTGFFGKYLGLASGIAVTEMFSPRFSVDVAGQYQYTFCYEGPLANNFFLDCDAGYYVFHHTLQLAGGFSFWYHQSKTDTPDTYGLSFHPGVTIETGKSFIIVFYTPIDLAGKDVDRFRGFSFAFTFSVR